MFEFPNKSMENNTRFNKIMEYLNFTDKHLKKSYKYWIYAWCLWKTETILNKDSNILDLGPGRNGFLLKYCAEKINCNVFAIDKRSKSKHLDGIDVNYSQKNFFNNEYEDNTFDVIYCISVIEHMSKEKRTELFKEIGRILKPGGQLILSSVETQYMLNGKENPAIAKGKLIPVPMEEIKDVDNLSLKFAGMYKSHPDKDNENILWNIKKGRQWTEYCCILKKPE